VIRNLKVVVLAVGAVLAFSAFGVATASAAEENFHCEVAHCIGTAHSETNQVFVTESGTVTCTTAKADFTTETTTTMEITATGVEYTGCTTKTIFGTIEVAVKFNGCDYLFTTATQPVHILCPAGANVTIVGPGCSITVAAQTVSSVSYTNIGAGTTTEVTLTANVTNITSSATGAFCSKTGTFTNGKYTGSIKVTGEDTLWAHKGVWYL